ncbi:hypothetical protein [Aequorivita marina]|uniref:hypothetical protein n=1 Tax=Aequorivita marina TaxID=3073654 RepID=UPI002875512E|nr:hypothetical protein [Aequorivita sp. S2608]MDS1298065.1 hypothetical protein [Aequorivita sp. S2608]
MRINIKLFVLTFFMFYLNVIASQVGIGTTDVNDDALLELDASQTYGGLLPPRVELVRTSNFAPLADHIQGMTIYNTITRNDVKPGKYYNDGNRWIRIEGSDIVDSVSLVGDLTFSNNNYRRPNGMNDLVFTARKSSVYLLLTSSGYGSANSMSTVYFQVVNWDVNPRELIGGTMTKIQNYDDQRGTVTTWSASFSKLLTGLTIGQEYRLRVRARTEAIYNGSTMVIDAASTPEACHLTLSAIH